VIKKSVRHEKRLSHKYSSTTRASKASISKRRVKNRYLMETDDASVSASVKKLKMTEQKYDINVNGLFGYRIIDFLTVFSAISELVMCKKCGTNIKFSEASIRGLGYKVVVACESTYINASPYYW